MKRYLVVANQTLGAPHLLETVWTRLHNEDCRFHIVVPATPPRGHLTWTEEEAGAIARRRLDEALSRFEALGADVDGEIGDASVVEAIGDALRNHRYDEILLSTLPPGISRWLALDLPHRVERCYGVRVTLLVGETEPA